MYFSRIFKALNFDFQIQGLSRCVRTLLIIQLQLFHHTGTAKRANSISNGNRTERSPIQSVIIRVITKSDDRAAGVRFVYHEYDYRLNWTTRSLLTN